MGILEELSKRPLRGRVNYEFPNWCFALSKLRHVKRQAGSLLGLTSFPHPWETSRTKWLAPRGRWKLRAAGQRPSQRSCLPRRVAKDSPSAHCPRASDARQWPRGCHTPSRGQSTQPAKPSGVSKRAADATSRASTGAASSEPTSGTLDDAGPEAFPDRCRRYRISSRSCGTSQPFDRA